MWRVNYIVLLTTMDIGLFALLTEVTCNMWQLSEWSQKYDGTEHWTTLHTRSLQCGWQCADMASPATTVISLKPQFDGNARTHTKLKVDRGNKTPLCMCELPN